MPNATTFAEILDARLGCTVVPPSPRTQSTRPLTAPLFAFEFPLQAPRHATPPPPQPNQATTPTLDLTLLERKAFDSLNVLGAGLDDSFTPATLRRAFRKLACRYHPDRHPAGSAAERERLARLFTEATDSYRLLTRRF